MKIFIAMPDSETTKTFFTQRALDELSMLGEVTQNPYGREMTEDEMVKDAADADVILCGWGTLMFTGELLKKLPNLKILAYTGGSMSSVVSPDAMECGVKVLTGNYIFAKSVAEACITYSLCALREIEKYMKLVRDGGWRPDVWENRGLFGKKIGIIGFGEIAKNFVKLLEPFDVEILVNSGHLTEEEAKDYGVVKADRKEIFSSCDIVSVHLALNEKTQGSIDRSLLELLKPDAILLNTARGAVIDEAAMTELLEQKRFFAALDVYEVEPLPVESKLRTLDNAVLLPHMGGPTIDMREYIVRSFVKDFIAYSKGESMKNVFMSDSLSRMTK